MPSNLVSLCVILAFFVAQIYIFFCVERIEIRVALAIFSAYQIYQKSRKFRPGSGPKGSDSEQTKADNWAEPKTKKYDVNDTPTCGFYNAMGVGDWGRELWNWE